MNRPSESTRNDPHAEALPSLHEAAEHGLLERVRELLDLGAPIDDTDGDGWTALMEAADMGHLAVVALLLDRHAMPLVADRQGFTAFALAEDAGHPAVAAHMRERGADREPAAALEHAISNEDLTTIALMAPIHGSTNPLPYGQLPLTFAAQRGKTKALDALIAAGAEVDQADRYNNRTALDHAVDYAVDRGDLSMVRTLLEGGATPRTNGAMHRAVGQGATDVVVALLDAGFDVNEARGERPLVEIALEFGHMALLRMLLDRGADVTGACGARLISELATRERRRDVQARWPFVGPEHYAELVDELLERGAPVDGDDYALHGRLASWIAAGYPVKLLDPQAALASAASSGEVTLASLALAQGADPSGGDVAPHLRPLYVAAVSRELKVFQHLLAAGADPNVRDHGSVAQRVVINGWLELLSELGAAGARLDGCVATLISAGTLPPAPDERRGIVSLCLTHGDDLDAPGLRGSTPLTCALQAAARQGRGSSLAGPLPDTDLARVLVALGANINGRSSRGMTPLMTAAELRSRAHVEWLITEGAAVDLQDDLGRTALMHAAQDLACCKLLVKAGANRSLVDVHGETAADYAGRRARFIKLLKV